MNNTIFNVNAQYNYTINHNYTTGGTFITPEFHGYQKLDGYGAVIENYIPGISADNIYASDANYNGK